MFFYVYLWVQDEDPRIVEEKWVFEISIPTCNKLGRLRFNPNLFLIDPESNNQILTWRIFIESTVCRRLAAA